MTSWMAWVWRKYFRWKWRWYIDGKQDRQWQRVGQQFGQKMKELPAQIKKSSQVNIKGSTALFVFLFVLYVWYSCIVMSWTILSSVEFLQYPINIPSSSVNYFHLLVVIVPIPCTMARSLHLTLLPVMNFRWFSAIWSQEVLLQDCYDLHKCCWSTSPIFQGEDFLKNNGGVLSREPWT